MLPPDAVRLPARFSNFMESIFQAGGMDLYYHEETGNVWMRFIPLENVMGPPASAHGGFCATMLDEAMGAAAWLNGHTVLAAKLEFMYRKIVPLGQTYYIRARPRRTDRRRVYVSSRLMDEEGALLTRGQGVFIRIDMGRFTEVPPELQRYAEFSELRKQGLTVEAAAASLGTFGAPPLV